MSRKALAIPLVLLVCLVLLAVGSAAAAPLPRAQPLAQRLTGTLNIISGDSLDLSVPPVEVVTLVNSEGAETVLLISEAIRNDLGLDFYRLNGQPVTVTGSAAAGPGPATANATAGMFTVTAIEPAPTTRATEAAAVTGNTKWLSIGCKFADITDEPKPLSYFQNMYGSTYPGLDAYWREASYDNINLAGSKAVGWFTLPKPMSAYQIDDTHIQWTDLLLDCAAQADPVVNFNDYMGINLMLNGEPGCCAWGGNRTVTLDGTYRNWSVTWLPPWSYAKLGYVQHEMTHGYGILWHSYANDNAYGDPWDVVSNAIGYWPNPYPTHPVYGVIGQHTQAYHRDYLGWVPSSRVIIVGEGKTTFSLEQATRPGASGYLMAVIPIDSSTSHFYALEARRRVGFDKDLLGNSITIHEIGGPRHLVQLMDPGAIGYQYGSYVWQTGQTWVAPEGGLTVHIDNAYASGFEVTVHTGFETRSLTIPVVADTYIEEESPLANFGDSQILRTQGSLSSLCANNQAVNCKVAFLRFESQPLPANIAHAWVRVTHTSDPISGSLSMSYQGADPSWEENRLTWATVPEVAFITAWYPYLHTPTASGADWKAWDISGMLFIHGSQIIESLMLDNGTLTFSSREGPNPPQLIIDYLVEPSTTAHTLTPTDDAFVKEAYPTTVYGRAVNLNVVDAAKDQRTFLKFDLSGLGTAERATLRLYANRTAPQGGTVYVVAPTYQGTTTPWLEGGLNWNKAPALTGNPVAMLGPTTAGSWVEVDVTAAARSAPGGVLSLGVGGGTIEWAAYSSKEGDHAPELVVETDGSTPPPPTIWSMTPTNDAYVDQTYANKVYGASKTLKVRNAAKDMNAYIKFNLVGVTDVSKATLRLYVSDPGPDGGGLYVVSPTYPGTTTQWLETNLTWKNAPPIGGTPLATLGPVKAKTWVEVDVTSAAQQALATNNGRLSLALHNNSTNQVVYSSKEGAHPPELIIEMTTP
jgi:hypothetical protein